MTSPSDRGRVPVDDQLRQCFQLEQSMTPDVPNATRVGFFLPGVTFETYENLSASGYARVLVENGEVQSYVLAAPPDHEVVHRLLGDKNKLIWFDQDRRREPDQAYWIAKIATAPPARRRGQAQALYQECFASFPNATALTATAVSPKRNHPSEDFHRALGFRPAGLFLSGNRPGLGEVVNIVWERPPTS